MKQYVDQKGSTHYTTEFIGTDAMGQWYRTKNESLILLDGTEDLDLSYVFESINVLPLQNIDEIVLPVGLLSEPHGGFLYHVPEKIMPLGNLLHHGIKKEADVSGGLKKRIDILMQLAQILLKLHSIPAMYGSLSPERIWITEKGPVKTYLLYSSFMSGSMFFQPLTVYDRYCADEFRKGHGSIASDIYCFAQLAKDLLTFPNNEEGTSSGLLELFEKVLQEPIPEKRPEIYSLYQELIKIRDKIVSCKQCKQDFVYTGAPCPYCSGPLSKLLKAEVYDKVSSQVRHLYTKVFDFVLDQQYFYQYHTSVVKPGETSIPTMGFRLHVSQDKRLHLSLKNMMEKPVLVQDTKLDQDREYKVTLPVSKIQIQIPQYSQTMRCIDIEIL